MSTCSLCVCWKQERRTVTCGPCPINCHPSQGQNRLCASSFALHVPGEDGSPLRGGLPFAAGYGAGRSWRAPRLAMGREGQGRAWPPPTPTPYSLLSSSSPCPNPSRRYLDPERRRPRQPPLPPGLLWRRTTPPLLFATVRPTKLSCRFPDIAIFARLLTPQLPHIRKNPQV